MLPSGLPAALSADPESSPFVDERAVVPVDPELVRRRVVGDVEVRPAVAVVVAGRDAEPGAVGFGDARALRDVDEAAVAVVAEQPVGDRPVRARPAVVARADRIGALLVGGDREVDVVGDEEIEIAVAVVVDERRARAPQRVADTPAWFVASVNVPSPLL